MPREDKKKKKKTKLGKLTNAEILKLIKKLKPKTSQVVKINIGDKGEKGQVKSSGVPQSGGAVVFTHGYGPPPPQPPSVPSAPLPPQPVIAAPTFNRQVVPFKPKQIQPSTKLSEVGFKEPAQPSNLGREVSSPSPSKVSGLTRTFSERVIRQLQRLPSGSLDVQKEFTAPKYAPPSNLGSNVRADSGVINEPYLSGLTETFGEGLKRRLQNLPRGGVELFQKEFTAPKYAPPSNLGSNVRAYQADRGVINDPYFNDRIQTVNGSDQAGVANAFTLSSDSWNLSPEGNVGITFTETPEGAGAAVEEEPPLAAADVNEDLISLITPEEQARRKEEDRQLQEFEQVFEKSALSKQKSRPLKSSTGAPVSNATVTQEINQAILTKGFNIGGYELSNVNIYQSGKSKGLLRNNLERELLEEIYTDLKGTY